MSSCAGVLGAPFGAQGAGYRRVRMRIHPFPVLSGHPRARVAARNGRERLARDDLISANGTVEKILGGGKYQIELESGQTVKAQLSGRMRRFRIRVIPGDRVTVGLSPYDPSHGFITFRLREGQQGPGR